MTRRTRTITRGVRAVRAAHGATRQRYRDFPELFEQVVLEALSFSLILLLPLCHPTLRRLGGVALRHSNRLHVDSNLRSGLLLLLPLLLHELLKHPFAVLIAPRCLSGGGGGGGTTLLVRAPAILVQTLLHYRCGGRRRTTVVVGAALQLRNGLI